MESGSIILSTVRSSKNIRSILLLSHVVAITWKIIIRKLAVKQKTKIIKNCYQNDKERMIVRMNIKVLGGGCSKCETLLANAKEAVANTGVEAEVEYITDFAVIASYGIMSTPALIVDEKIVSMGKVLKSSEIENFLK